MTVNEQLASLIVPQLETLLNDHKCGVLSAEDFLRLLREIVRFYHLA